MISRIIRILVTLVAIALAVIVVLERKSYLSLLPQRVEVIEEVETPQLMEQDTILLLNLEETK